MDSFGARVTSRPENGVDGKVALDGRRRPDADGSIGEGDVRRRRVGVGIDGYRFDPKFTACPDDPNRDFAAIGDQ
jgi:hypothetical protein